MLFALPSPTREPEDARLDFGTTHRGSLGARNPTRPGLAEVAHRKRAHWFRHRTRLRMRYGEAPMGGFTQ
jgi:hypothetical protein